MNTSEKILILSYLLLVFFTVGCEDLAEKRKFENPNDPKAEKANASKTSSQNDPTTNTTTTGNPGAPNGQENTSQNEEDFEVKGSFNFSHVISVTPEGCSEVKKIKFFDNNSDLMVFVQTKCSTRQHVYAVTMTYSGETTSTPKLITSDCNTGSGIIGFDVDKGSSNYLMSYACQDDDATFKIIPISLDGIPGISKEVSTMGRIAWNDEAKAFGFAGYPLGLQRFDEHGETIGGPIEARTASLSQFSVFDGEWLVYSESQGYSMTINQSGAIKCKDGPIANYRAVFLSKDLFLEFSIGVQGIYTYSFDGTTCKDVKRRGDVVYASFGSVFNGIMLDETMAVALYETNSSTNKSLTVTTIDISSGSLYADSSVAGFSTLNFAEVRAIDNKIYVGYDKNGEGFISYSEESIR